MYFRRVSRLPWRRWQPGECVVFGASGIGVIIRQERTVQRPRWYREQCFYWVPTLDIRGAGRSAQWKCAEPSLQLKCTPTPAGKKMEAAQSPLNLCGISDDCKQRLFAFLYVHLRSKAEPEKKAREWLKDKYVCENGSVPTVCSQARKASSPHRGTRDITTIGGCVGSRVQFDRRPSPHEFEFEILPALARCRCRGRLRSNQFDTRRRRQQTAMTAFPMPNSLSIQKIPLSYIVPVLTLNTTELINIHQ